MFQLLVGIYLIKVFYLGQSVSFCTFLKTLILLSLVVLQKLSIQKLCVWWETEIRSSPLTISAPSKPIFTKTPNTSLCCLICMKLSSLLPLLPPLCQSRCTGHRKYQNMHLTASEMPLHGAACASLSHAMNMNPYKSPHKTAWLYNLDFVFRPFMFAPFFLQGITLPLYSWYILSSLDLNNGCFPSDWHHTESLFSACSAVENRMVKVIWTERCSFMVSRLQPWFIISSPVSLTFGGGGVFLIVFGVRTIFVVVTHAHRATYRYAHRYMCTHTSDRWLKLCSDKG